MHIARFLYSIFYERFITAIAFSKIIRADSESNFSLISFGTCNLVSCDAALLVNVSSIKQIGNCVYSATRDAKSRTLFVVSDSVPSIRNQTKQIAVISSNSVGSSQRPSEIIFSLASFTIAEYFSRSSFEISPEESLLI